MGLFYYHTVLWVGLIMGPTYRLLDKIRLIKSTLLSPTHWRCHGHWASKSFIYLCHMTDNCFTSHQYRTCTNYRCGHTRISFVKNREKVSRHVFPWSLSTVFLYTEKIVIVSSIFQDPCVFVSLSKEVRKSHRE